MGPNEAVCPRGMGKLRALGSPGFLLRASAGPLWASQLHAPRPRKACVQAPAPRHPEGTSSLPQLNLEHFPPTAGETLLCQESAFKGNPHAQQEKTGHFLATGLQEKKLLSCQNHCLRENTKVPSYQRRWHLQGRQKGSEDCLSPRALALNPSLQPVWSRMGWGRGHKTTAGHPLHGLRSQGKDPKLHTAKPWGGHSRSQQGHIQ